MTAVEWYAARIHDIEFKKSVGAISVIEYYEELTKALEQAKEIEENLAEAFATFAEFAILTDRRTLNPIKFKDWCKQYNEKTI
jgi:hypothetical protein